MKRASLCAGSGKDVSSSPARECPALPGAPEGAWLWCWGTLSVPLSHHHPPVTRDTLLHVLLSLLGQELLGCSISTLLNPNTFLIIRTGGNNWTYRSKKIVRNCCVPGDKRFWILLHGCSSPKLILISLSFPRHIVAVEIYLWKHFAGGGPKYERFSVKSLGKRKN